MSTAAPEEKSDLIDQGTKSLNDAYPHPTSDPLIRMPVLYGPTDYKVCPPPKHVVKRHMIAFLSNVIKNLPTNAYKWHAMRNRTIEREIQTSGEKNFKFIIERSCYFIEMLPVAFLYESRQMDSTQDVASQSAINSTVWARDTFLPAITEKDLTEIYHKAGCFDRSNRLYIYPYRHFRDIAKLCIVCQEDNHPSAKCYEEGRDHAQLRVQAFRRLASILPTHFVLRLVFGAKIDRAMDSGLWDEDLKILSERYPHPVDHSKAMKRMLESIPIWSVCYCNAEQRVKPGTQLFTRLSSDGTMSDCCEAIWTVDAPPNKGRMTVDQKNQLRLGKFISSKERHPNEVAQARLWAVELFTPIYTAALAKMEAYPEQSESFKDEYFSRRCYVQPPQPKSLEPHEGPKIFRSETVQLPPVVSFSSLQWIVDPPPSS